MDFHKNDRFAADNMRTESEDCLYLNIFSPYVSIMLEFSSIIYTEEIKNNKVKYVK